MATGEPNLLIVSIGPGLGPTGDFMCAELSRLTPCSVFHIPSDGRPVPDETWAWLEARVAEVEVQCLCMYDARTARGVAEYDAANRADDGFIGVWECMQDGRGVFYLNTRTRETSRGGYLDPSSDLLTECMPLADAAGALALRPTSGGGSGGGGASRGLDPAWAMRVAALLAAADRRHEVMFVYDRTQDGHRHAAAAAAAGGGGTTAAAEEKKKKEEEEEEEGRRRGKRKRKRRRKRRRGRKRNRVEGREGRRGRGGRRKRRSYCWNSLCLALPPIVCVYI